MRKQDGYVLVTALLALAVMALLGAAALSWAGSSLRLSRQAVQSEQAFYLANAGAEAALALAASGGNLDAGPLTYTMTVAPGQTGSYNVTLTRQADGTYSAVSVGTFGSATRQVTARVSPPQPGGDSALQPLIVSGGQISLSSRTVVCGDVIANGDILLGTQTVVWSQDRIQNTASPCDTVQGTGQARANGRVTLASKSEVQGGICDAAVFGQGTPCAAPPQLFAAPSVNMAALKQQATRWYVRDPAYCSGKPAGRCTWVPAGYVLSVSGSQSFAGDLIYVEGTVNVPAASLTYRGLVTFAATAGISLDGNAVPNASLCTASTPCGAAFLTDGPLVLEKRVTAWGIFATNSPDGLSWGSDAQFYGQVYTPRLVSANNRALFFPNRLPALPPGAPVFTPATGGGAGGGGYAGWN